MACLARQQHLRATWGKLFDRDLLLSIGLVGFCRVGQCAFSGSEASRVAASLVNYTRELLLREIEFLWSYHGDLPARLAAFLSPNEADRKAAATFVGAAFAAVTRE